MENSNLEKKILGQFFTTTNPFSVDIFHEWFSLIPENKKEILLEPFAGANNIVKMIQDLGYIYNWNCFDIIPKNKENATPEFIIKQQDTLEDFPKGYYVGITNPPYLAKNSASKTGLPFPETNYDDLYKVALKTMLDHLEYVAAIIPESFITAEIFQERIYAFISLTCKMFEDTECPVCLALFVPEKQKTDFNLSQEDFYIYRQNTNMGKYKDFKEKIPKSNLNLPWKFNDKNGEIGIYLHDGREVNSIRFVPGTTIKPEKVKVSSRHVVRVSGLPNDIDLNIFLEKCNNKLAQFREDTQDFFFTSFRGLRKDGKYRRRLDFKNAKIIMNAVIEEIHNLKTP
jgi:hypothetical protein